MSNYRRAWRKGGTYFFTVNLLERYQNDLLVRHIDVLRQVVKDVKRKHPFIIHAWVVLPEHMHCVIELPEGDDDFATRWRLIKIGFSKAMPKTERLSAVRVKRGERAIWQRRFWEHCIRNEADHRAHIDYIHMNPVKHGYVKRVQDWRYSSFHRFVADGLLDVDWGS